MVGKTAEALWKDYQFLTKEMLKFLVKQDMDLFYELMNQREKLQTSIDQAVDNDFDGWMEGWGLLAEIQQDSQSIINNLQFQLHYLKRQHQVSEAYGAASTTAVSQMNWNR